jgi:hypothetical protein
VSDPLGLLEETKDPLGLLGEEPKAAPPPEKARKPFYSRVRADVGDILNTVGNAPKIVGGLLEKAGTYAGRQELVEPYIETGKEAFSGGVTKPIGMAYDYASEHPLNAALAVAPYAPGAARLARELMPGGKTPPLSETVRYGMEKGVRPSVVGKAEYPQVEKYFEKAESGVKSIIKNKANLEFTGPEGEPIKGKLPENLNEFSSAIHQTKENIFGQYDALANKSGQTGERVSLQPIVRELNAAKNNTAIKLNHPETVKYIDGLIQRYSEMGDVTPIQAQHLISDFNNSLQAFYKNPSYETTSRAATDALVANHLRKGLDTFVSKLEGPGYQQLKNEYGALKEIEKDVTHRAVVDSRKNVKGLIDFSNIWSNAQLVRGIVTFNPAEIGAGTIAKLTAWYTKYLNNPNPKIAGMFQKAEKAYTPELERIYTSPPTPKPYVPQETPTSEVVPSGPIRYPEPNYPKYGPENLAGRVPSPEFPPGSSGGGPIRYPIAEPPSYNYPEAPPQHFSPEFPMSGPERLNQAATPRSATKGSSRLKESIEPPSSLTWAQTERGIYEGSRGGTGITEYVIEKRGKEFIVSKWDRGAKKIGTASTLEEAKKIVEGGR